MFGGEIKKRLNLLLLLLLIISLLAKRYNIFDGSL